jgi:thymidine kinase
MHLTPRNTGWIEVICGSMFSGKTEELIRRLKRAQIAQQRVQVFKPRIDRRYDEVHVVSHSSQKLVSEPVDGAGELLARVAPETQVVGIDEVQFLGPEVVSICETLANRGLRVICAGLDQDYRGRPFDPMPTLLAIAEFITKEHAICVVCGNPANRSQRLIDVPGRVMVGGLGEYEPRCRRCFVPVAEVETEPPAEQAKLFQQ